MSWTPSLRIVDQLSRNPTGEACVWFGPRSDVAVVKPEFAVFLKHRSGYDLGAQLSNLKVGAGVKNIFDKQYFTRSSDNNSGMYVGAPRTFFVQASVGF
ncbi:TonB-dependent receptor-like protein [Pseudomonas sp. 478]|nr:TonB-dependent receptor-like protein [Pseudomonas sp. 478]TCV41612.1 TonB-dependent receptor-like protein [Pseudomonas sp. 460]